MIWWCCVEIRLCHWALLGSLPRSILSSRGPQVATVGHTTPVLPCRLDASLPRLWTGNSAAMFKQVYTPSCTPQGSLWSRTQPGNLRTQGGGIAALRSAVSPWLQHPLQADKFLHIRALPKSGQFGLGHPAVFWNNANNSPKLSVQEAGRAKHVWLEQSCQFMTFWKGVLRPAQWGRKPHVDQNGKSWLDLSLQNGARSKNVDRSILFISEFEDRGVRKGYTRMTGKWLVDVKRSQQRWAFWSDNGTHLKYSSGICRAAGTRSTDRSSLLIVVYIKIGLTFFTWI